MTDDDTSTSYLRDRVDHSITLETQGSGPGARGPWDAGNEDVGNEEDENG